MDQMAVDFGFLGIHTQCVIRLSHLGCLCCQAHGGQGLSWVITFLGILAAANQNRGRVFHWFLSSLHYLVEGGRILGLAVVHR